MHNTVIKGIGLFWSIIQVMGLFGSCAEGAKVQLFVDKDYSALHLEINLTDTCYNVPSNKHVSVLSIITDSCVIAYNQPNCKAAWSSKHMPGKMLATDLSLGYFGYIRSLHTCNDHEGGPTLHVDLTSWFENKNPPVTPDVLESYHDVCSCQNIPKYIQDSNKWSINNHGNGLFAYFEHDCTEKQSDALYINAGHWKNSRDMHKHTRSYNGTTMKIQSFGPALNTTYFRQSCSKYPNDKIIEVEQIARSLKQFAVNNEEQMQTHDAKLEVLITEFQSLLRKVDKLAEQVSKFHEQAELNLENTKHEFNDKLEKQRDEMQDLADQFNSHIHE